MYLACLTKIAAGVGCAALLLAGGDAPLSVATAVASDDCTALTQTPSRRRGFTGALPLSNASLLPRSASGRGRLSGAAARTTTISTRRQRAGWRARPTCAGTAPPGSAPSSAANAAGGAVLRSPANSPYRRLGLGQAPEPARRPVGGVPGSGLSLFAKTHATTICIPLTYSQRGDPRIWKACTLSASPGRARNRGCDCSLPCLRPSFRRPARCTKCLLTCRQEP